MHAPLQDCAADGVGDLGNVLQIASRRAEAAAQPRTCFTSRLAPCAVFARYNGRA